MSGLQQRCGQQLEEEHTVSHITISINEQPEQVAQSSSLSDIILVLSLPDLGCVFAINNAVVPRSQWQQTIVNEAIPSLFSSYCRGANHVNHRR